MNEMKHTPGPWMVIHHKCIHPHITIAQNAGTSLRDRSIAYIDGHMHEDNANAALIAAAPDLLAALQMVVDSLVTWIEIAEDEDLRDYDNNALSAARAAIAKARGED